MKSLRERPRASASLKLLEYALPSAVFRPAVKALKNGVMIAEALGQVGSGSPGSSDPKHGVDEGAIVLGSASGVAFFSGQQVLDAFPIFVGDFVASHRGQVSFLPEDAKRRNRIQRTLDECQYVLKMYGLSSLRMFWVNVTIVTTATIEPIAVALISAVSQNRLRLSVSGYAEPGSSTGPQAQASSSPG